MVKRLHQRASNIPYDREQPGCMWGVLQLFSSHYRLNGRKTTPSDYRRGSEGKHASGSKYSKLKKNPYSNISDYEHTDVKLHSNVNQKKETFPVTPRLRRTLSIHHLECNDYILPIGNGTPENESDSKEVSSGNVNEVHSQDETSESIFFENQELRSEVEDTKRNLQTHQEVNSTSSTMVSVVIDERKHQDADESVNSKMAKFFKTIQAPDILLSGIDMKAVENFTSTPVLARSGSYPGTRNLRSSLNSGESTRRNRKEAFSSKGISEITANDLGLSLLHHKDAKQRLKDIAKDNNESQFIVLDGILDKVPYGHKISRDQVHSFSKYPWRSKSGRDWSSMAEKRHTIPRFSRSRSHSDSLERYSNFLEAESNAKSDLRSTIGVKLVNEGSSSIGKRNLDSRSYGRAHSLPEFLIDFPTKDDSRKNPDVTISIMKSAIESNESFQSVGPKEEEIIKLSQDADGVLQEDNQSHASYCEEIDIKIPEYSETGEQSPQSVLDTDFQDDATNLADILEVESYTVSHQVVQKLDDAAGEIAEMSLDIGLQSSELDELRAQVERTLEDDFDYVVNVLAQAGFYGSSVKDSSPELPLSLAVFRELEGLEADTEICTLYADIDLDHLLLFDLVSDVIIAMRENSSSPFPRNPQFISGVKPFPEGLKLLKEVWSVISHLSSCSSKSQGEICYDIEKNASWSNLSFEVEDVGMKIGNLIMDELIDEIISGCL